MRDKLGLFLGSFLENVQHRKLTVWPHIQGQHIDMSVWTCVHTCGHVGMHKRVSATPKWTFL